MDQDKRLDKDLETLKGDISKLREDLTGIAQILLEKGKSETEAARDKSKETVESLERQIKEKPMLSLIIAFILGLFLGKLFDRR